ncbi:MAG: hypothetical protein GC162_20380 [Planctomycetes bacterium]|nr:hypothetical protein [Planctomycetota bacterium]
MRIPSRQLTLIVGLLATLMLSTQARAAFVLVENFNALTDGGVDGQNGWTASDASVDVTSAAPASPADKALQSGSTSTAAYKTVASINNGSTGTVYFQFNASVTTPGTSFGLADASISLVSNTFNSYRPQIAIDAAGAFVARDGGSFVTLDQSVAANIWYSVWMVANNSSDTFKAYIQGGAFATQTQLTANAGVKTSFAFRNDETGTAALTNFLFAHGGGTDSAIVVDNIYIDAAGQNLAAPVTAVPAPAALPAGLTLMSLLMMRRR